MWRRVTRFGCAGTSRLPASCRQYSERRFSARHAASSSPSSLLLVASPSLSLSLLHPAFTRRDARIDPAAGAREDALHRDARRRRRRRRLLSGGGKPSPRRFLETKISQRERIRSRTGDIMANLTVSHQLVAPFNCIHYDECHPSSSRRRRHATLLAFNDRPYAPRSIVPFGKNLFPIVPHFISIFFNYLFNVFGKLAEISFRKCKNI